MKQLNIIHVIKGRVDLYVMNGVLKVVHNLASTQFMQQHNVQVWGITGSSAVVSHEYIYPLLLFPAMRNRFRVSSSMLDALDKVEKGTIFHLHSVFTPELYAVAMQLKKRGFVWVATPHGGYTPEALKKNWLAKKIYKWLFEDRLIQGAGAIHMLGTHGEAEQFDTTKFNIGVVPNGYTPNERHKQNWDNSVPLRICYCGRLVIFHKGLDILINGVDLAVKQGLDVTLDLIGDGPDRSKLENMVRQLKLDKRVEFLGQKYGSDKDTLIIKSDLFAHTSRFEGLPTAVLEAAGMGIPLLVTYPTNIAEYVLENDAGNVVNELNAESVAHSIEISMNEKRDGTLQKKGTAAYQMIVQQFSWDSICLRLTETVYSLAANKSMRPNQS